jgi:hypothetical protein
MMGLTKMTDGTYAQNTTAIPGDLSSSANVFSVPASLSAVNVLTANSTRKGRPSVYYDDTALMYVLAGTGTPSATNYTVIMGSGKVTYWTPEPSSYTGAIRAVWSAATGAAKVTEYV